jgi:16S rRNA processing protein RimM
LKCDPTNAGRPVIVAGAALQCVRGSESRAVEIVSVRAHKGRLLIRIAGVDDANSAQALAGAVLTACRERIPLQPGEYFDEDLAGCAVVGTQGQAYGTVDRVEHYPASDMLVVGGRMVPMVSAIVREIDPAARRIVIDPPEGLLE